MEKYKLKCVRCGRFFTTVEIAGACRSCLKKASQEKKAARIRAIELPPSEESEVLDDIVFGSVLGFWDDIF